MVTPGGTSLEATGQPAPINVAMPYLCTMKQSVLTLVVAVLWAAIGVQAGEEIPGAPQTTPVVITNATIHRGNGEVLQGASVMFEEGLITAIGPGLEAPANATVIDGTGKHVYPGFILPATTLGLTEIDAVRPTHDMNEVGPFNPNVTAATAYDPDSELIPTIRTNGILLANAAPTGGTISGMSSLMRLDGWTKEDLAVQMRSGLVVNWPNMSGSKPRWSEMTDDEWQKQQQEAVKGVEDYFRAAYAYARAAEVGLDNSKNDIRFEAMRRVFDGTLPVIVSANYQRQIEAALDLAEEYNLRLIIRGGAEADRVADRLNKRRVPVILRRVHSLPIRAEAPYDEAFTLPAALAEAGVEFCFEGSGAWRQRDVPFEAGTACAYGLDKERAVQALTLSAARIFGVEDRFGSLEVGKSATLFVSAGDALDVRSNIVEHAWIDGRTLDLSNRHKRLSTKYRERAKR